jgi:hypothetical protein
MTIWQMQRIHGQRPSPCDYAYSSFCRGTSSIFRKSERFSFPRLFIITYDGATCLTTMLPSARFLPPGGRRVGSKSRSLSFPALAMHVCPPGQISALGYFGEHLEKDFQVDFERADWESMCTQLVSMQLHRPGWISSMALTSAQTSQAQLGAARRTRQSCVPCHPAVRRWPPLGLRKRWPRGSLR